VRVDRRNAEASGLQHILHDPQRQSPHEVGILRADHTHAGVPGNGFAKAGRSIASYRRPRRARELDHPRSTAARVRQPRAGTPPLCHEV